MLTIVARAPRTESRRGAALAPIRRMTPPRKVIKLMAGHLTWLKCYSCGQNGHRKADFTKRVSRVIVPRMEDDLIISGRVGNKHLTRMKVDMGFQVTVVHPDLCEPVHEPEIEDSCSRTS